jgi:transglutaminase-like putative cysteine protease
MRHRILHRSTYRYGGSVRRSFNEARLIPAARPWQYPLEFAITVDCPSWQHSYWDYWGTEVRVVEVNAPHTSVEITSSSIVEVDAQRRTAPTVGWDVLRDGATADRLAEYLAVTEATEPPGDLVDQAREHAARHDPRGAAEAIADDIHRAMTYQPGATQVHSRAVDAWSERTGVCQDYAHLAIGAMRGVGLPARYVSGYLHPDPDPDIGTSAVGESHAWVEYWAGDWHALDPTNDTPVADRHVTVANGRHYADVAPIKGIVAGSAATTQLDVEVLVTRLR